MNISTRITEYSITGGLLWVNIFLFATIIDLQMHHQQINIGDAMQLWGSWLDVMMPLTATLDKLPASLQSSMSTLFGALAIIVIFLSGILLDMASPIFFKPFEVFIFYKSLVAKNRGWLDRLIEANEEFVGEDYRGFVNGRLIDLKHPFGWFKRRSHYNKISSFLLSHVMINSQSSALDELMDRMHLWRTSRAISTSLVVLACLLNFTPLVPFSITRVNAAAVLITSMIIPVLLISISAMITLGTYSRMCLSLCALAYSTTQQRSDSA